jgi:hypothetical protein
MHMLLARFAPSMVGYGLDAALNGPGLGAWPTKVRMSCFYFWLAVECQSRALWVV